MMKNIKSLLSSNRFLLGCLKSQIMFKSEYYRAFLTADAIIFHDRNIDVMDLPSVRHYHQNFVYFNQESPRHSNIQGLPVSLAAKIIVQVTIKNWSITLDHIRFRFRRITSIPPWHIVKNPTTGFHMDISILGVMTSLTKRLVIMFYHNWTWQK